MPAPVSGNNWEKIRQGLRDAQLLNSQRRYNLSMIKCRQTLEFMVKDLCDKASIITTNANQDLASLIDELYSNRQISKTTCEHYHKIRILGNKAAHEGNENAYDANQACQLLSHEVVTFSKDYMNEARLESQQHNSQQRPQQYGSQQRSQQRSSQQGQQRPSQQRPQQRSSQQGIQQRGSQQGAQQRGSQQRPQQRPQGGDGAARSRSGAAASSTRSRRRSQDGFPLSSTDLMRIAIVVAAVILVIVLVRFLHSGDSSTDESTETSSTEFMTDESTSAPEDTVPTTAAPETMAETTPAPVYKTTDYLNVRAEPSTNSRRLGVLERDTVVTYIDDYDENWAIIEYEGTQAYVSKEYLVHD